MKASTQENIAAAIFCVCLVGFLTVATSSWTRAYDRASFRKLAGIGMEEILSAKAKCEAINGVGNCQLTGGYGNKNKKFVIAELVEPTEVPKEKAPKGIAL